MATSYVNKKLSYEASIVHGEEQNYLSPSTVRFMTCGKAVASVLIQRLSLIFQNAICVCIEVYLIKNASVISDIITNQ